MCWTCVADEYEEAGLPVPDWEETIRALHANESHRDLVVAIGDWYEIPLCSVGGPLHITTDDNNVDDRSLDFCEENLERYRRGGGYKDPDCPPLTEADLDLGQSIIDGLRALPLHTRSAICEAGSYLWEAVDAERRNGGGLRLELFGPFHSPKSPAPSPPKDA